MTPADVRLTAQLVVDKRVHCVSDEAVMAMARRVLELEADCASISRELGLPPFLRPAEGEVSRRFAFLVETEREACAKLADSYGWNENDADPSKQWRRDGRVDQACRDVAAAIRARGAK